MSALSSRGLPASLILRLESCEWYGTPHTVFATAWGPPATHGHTYVLYIISICIVSRWDVLVRASYSISVISSDRSSNQGSLGQFGQNIPRYLELQAQAATAGIYHIGNGVPLRGARVYRANLRC